jgi:recombination protein RecT
MAGQELQVVEQQLNQLAPQFEQVLEPLGIPPARIVRTVLVSLERTPKLLQCNRQSVLNGAMTAACLGLEVDGVTGQGFLIPFKDQAQFVVGYKGYNTMASRAGFTVNGGVVREGDDFDFDEGSQPYVHHKRKLGEESKRQIIAAWATATKPGATPIVSILSRDQIDAIRGKSPGARKQDSPWNDPSIGFPAMAEKSAKRRLARNMPLNTFLQAASLEEQFEERGKPSWIAPGRGVVADGEVIEPETVDAGEPTAPAGNARALTEGDRQYFLIHLPDRDPKQFADFDRWCAQWDLWIQKATDADRLAKLQDLNQDTFDQLHDQGYDVKDVERKLSQRVRELRGNGDGQQEGTLV